MEGPSRPSKRVRARAPLRLGLAGGGTDLSPYSDRFGGAVLNVAIGRYAHASVEMTGDPSVVVSALDLDLSESHPAGVLPTGGRLAIHCAVYNRIVRDFCAGRPFGARIRTFIDAQPGSGLGSSSALTVGLVEAFRFALGLPLGRYDVAHLAFEVERLDLALAGGKQDQYASAFGGINFIEFLANDRVIVNPLRVDPATLRHFESALVICYSGQSRASEAVIRDQIAGVVHDEGVVINSLHELKAHAIEMKLAMLQGNLSLVADILNRSWEAKKSTAGSVTNPHVDRLWTVGRSSGAIAGKVSGAGGGGYIMFLCDPDDRVSLMRALRDAGGSPDSVAFTAEGVEAWHALG